LLAKLEIFDQELEARQQAAQRYSQGLNTVLEVPWVSPVCTSVWAQYSVMSPRRQLVQQKLQEQGIPSAIYYPVPLHLQRAFQDLGHQAGDFPVSEAVSGRIFSLPMHPYLRADDQQRIMAVIEDCHL
jgi:dTDP-4-amino-4,6-dideoxygalactose transaminase